MSVEAGDRELIDGCLAGDRRSWDLFVDRFAGLIHWNIHRTFEATPQLGRREVLDDVFQDVFRKLIEKEELARLRDVKSVRKFLTVIACNAAIDRMKGLSRRERLSVSQDAPLSLKNGDKSEFSTVTLESADLDPGETASRRESDAIVAETLSHLTARERACVEMHFIDGKTHSQIGMILGIPPDTVSTVLRRTREILKDKFIQKGL